MIWQNLPDLSTGVLAEMGGWATLKQARILASKGAVRSLEWNAPVLTACVEIGQQKFPLRLNLRSTTFAENRCNCEKGRRGLMCEHALAACITADGRRKEEEKQAFAPKKERPEERKTPEPDLRSFEIDGKGKPLEPRFILPPNFTDSAKRNMIVLKLELLCEGRRTPPEKLFKGCVYKVAKEDLASLKLVESWTRDKLASLLQIRREQMHALLETLAEKPRFEWANRPGRAIEWEGGQLEGVSALVTPEKTETPPKVSVRRSVGVITSVAQMRINARQTPKRIPAVTLHQGTGEEPEESGMTVDGSPNYLAVGIPHDHPLHSRAKAMLENGGFRIEPRNGRWWLRDRHKVLNFLAEHRDELDRVFAPEYSDNFRTRMVAVRKAKIRAKGTSERDGSFKLDIGIDAGPLGTEEIRRALASRQFYVISGESIWLLPPTLLSRLAEAQSALSGSKGQILMPSISRKLNAAQLCDAGKILEEVADEIETPTQWKNRVTALRNIANLKQAPVPQTLDERLRGYQRIGAAWMWHLYRFALGGVLADEMGLGKTVQAVALMTAVESETKGSQPMLVVCPAGLIENWIRECHRFAPQLRVTRHHGQDRVTDANGIANAQLVVTSYQTLTRDVELFAPVPFSLIIADEAQHIKNRRTQAAAALRSLQAKARFVLTGTPIENSLDDLRSIFAFILPGYLARLPDGVRGEDRSWYDQRHLDQCVPYILRRSKTLVAPELPEKLEQTVFCDFSPAQAKFYAEMKEKSQHAMFELEMGGASEGRLRMEAFTQLLRLRQICADPRLLKPETDPADSAKLRALEEILNEAVDGGHRALVFSQFVGALKLISAMLEEKGLSYCYIDGSTKNRQAECDRFNGDDSIPVFLISLKAGGTGLNLTGADTVVHYDPWWNPAVEAQATDRAHRIGQTRTVTSLKLIAAGTVEEKVLEMQRTKAKLLEELLDESAAQTSKISLADIRALME